MRSFRRDEVAPSELPIKFMGRIVVRLGGLYRRLERPQMNCRTVDMDSGQVRLTSLMVGIRTNAPKTSLVIRMNSLIANVLRVRRLPEIVFLAIKTVSVDVVSFFFRETKDESVKGNPLPSLHPALRDMRHRVESARFFVLLSTPLKAANNVRIFIVDQCRLALSQRNYNHVSLYHISEAT